MFAWISNYKNIKNIGANFGGETSYSFADNILKFQKNQAHIPLFFNLADGFNRANLMNITGIVGENGTGKSSIIEFLLHVFNGSIRKISPQTRYLIIYSMNNQYYYLQYLENNIITIENKLHDIKHSFTLGGDEYLNSGLGSNCSIIFFSNVYDARALDKITPNHESGTKFINLSTNYISTKFTDSSTKSLQSDFTKQFIFLKKYQDFIEEYTQLNVPEYINVSVNRFNDDIGEQDSNVIDNEDYYQILGDIDDGFDSLIENNKLNYGIFNLNFHKHLIMSLFADLIALAKKITSNSFLRSSLLEVCEHSSNDFFFEYNPPKDKDMYKILQNILDEKLNEVENDKSLIEWRETIADYKKHTVKFIKSRVQLISHLKEIYKKEKMEDENDDLSIKLKTDSRNLGAFVNVYHKISGNYSFLNFIWSELSSGEHALLTLFGRFYAESRESSKNIIILIDEGDLYFHPQWQKEWLFIFNNLITIMFKNTNIHIILTTHSPFVLSDLPGNNVIFLKKDSYGKTVIGKGLEETPLTYASNIHSLLIDSFFIKNGLCGSFAKYKINMLIDYILRADIQTLKSGKKIIQNEIDIIGEPLVKKKIISILQDKIGLDLLNIDDKIANLQKQIDQLRKLK